LQTLAPQSHTVQLQNLLNTALFPRGVSVGCPADLSTQVVQMQASCAWVRGSGTWANQSVKGGDPGSTLTGAATWLGGQVELAPGWFLGGAFGYGESWANATNFSSHGEIYNGSLSLRRVDKAWTFSGSLAGRWPAAGGVLPSPEHLLASPLSRSRSDSCPAARLCGIRLGGPAADVQRQP
jgi:hypothetical protein